MSESLYRHHPSLNGELLLQKAILKVSKFQKQIFLFSFEPKNEQNYFLISALASKNGSNKKNEGTLLYYLGAI